MAQNLFIQVLYVERPVKIVSGLVLKRNDNYRRDGIE